MRRVFIGVSAWLVGTLPFLVQLVSGRTSRDVEHYLASARAALEGAGIYTSVTFEYPPYALAWFLGPAAMAGDLAEFRVFLGLVMWSLDAAVKGALILARFPPPRPAYRPAALPDVQTLATTALTRILLQRYNLIPAAMSFGGAILLTSGWPLLAGIAIAAAAGTKLFPALYFPVMAAFAWRRGSRTCPASWPEPRSARCRSSPCHGRCRGGNSSRVLHAGSGLKAGWLPGLGDMAGVTLQACQPNGKSFHRRGSRSRAR